MAEDVTAIIEGSEFLVYTAPHDDANDFPDEDTVDYGEVWGTPWVHMGLTREGVNVNIGKEHGSIMVDQSVDPVLMPLTSRDIRFAFRLAQGTAAHFQIASGQGAVTALAADVGTKGYDQLEFADTPTPNEYHSVGYDCRQQDGQPHRGIVYKALAVGGMESRMQRGDAPFDAPVEVRALRDTGRLARFRWITAALPPP